MLISPPPAAASSSGGSVRDMYIVAHQDDDVLFINPDVLRSIAAGHTVKTIYVTAGANTCTGSSEFWLGREAGVMAAYAAMAGVANSWTLRDEKPVREITLAGRPKVSLVFFRLPHGGIDGSFCTADGGNLRALWLGKTGVLTALDGSAAYSKQQLIAALASEITQFHPDTLGTLDGSGFNGTGQDPSGLMMLFSSTTGLCDWYDNSDHYYAATFTAAAAATYAKPHVFQGYRGYNIGNEEANVSGMDLVRKELAFAAYAQHDPTVSSSSPPFCAGTSAYCLYDNWQERQYRVDVGNPPDATTCSVPVTCDIGYTCNY